MNMGNKKILSIISAILIIVGVSICFCVAIFSNQEVEVRIERAGVCNPLKPVKDKEVKTDSDTKKKLAKYWKNTDKNIQPDANEMVDTLVGDYKLFVEDDEILFNLDLSYVSFNGKYVLISNEFIGYLSDVVRENDKNLRVDEEVPDVEDIENDLGEGECCSCCPDLKPGEACIEMCCPCSDK
jgi:hypothetical protein